MSIKFEGIPLVGLENVSDALIRVSTANNAEIAIVWITIIAGLWTLFIWYSDKQTEKINRDEEKIQKEIKEKSLISRIDRYIFKVTDRILKKELDELNLTSEIEKIVEAVNLIKSNNNLYDDFSLLELLIELKNELLKSETEIDEMKVINITAIITTILEEKEKEKAYKQYLEMLEIEV